MLWAVHRAVQVHGAAHGDVHRPVHRTVHRAVSRAVSRAVHRAVHRAVSTRRRCGVFVPLASGCLRFKCTILSFIDL